MSTMEAAGLPHHASPHLALQTRPGAEGDDAEHAEDPAGTTSRQQGVRCSKAGNAISHTHLKMRKTRSVRATVHACVSNVNSADATETMPGTIVMKSSIERGVK